MSALQDRPGSPAEPIGSARGVEVDLAFCAEEDWDAALLQAGGPWLDGGGQGAATWEALLAHWLSQLQAELPAALQARGYSLGLSLVDDGAMAALNRDWRHQDGPTDVLAFAAQDQGLGEAPAIPVLENVPARDGEELGHEPLELGDIVVSVPTAARQARELGHSLERELLFLASHGLLHLLGWDHPDEADLAAMLARQEALISHSPALAQPLA